MNLNKDKIVVSKFGGTSMQDTESMNQSAKVCIRQNSKVVVVSATAGTTNDLILLCELAKNDSFENAEVILNKIKKRHYQMASDLNLKQDRNTLLNHLLEELSMMTKGINLLRDCSFKAMDTVLSFGERLSSILFTQALENQYSDKKFIITLLDAREIIKTDNRFSKAKVNMELTKLKAQEFHLANSPGHIFVTQGFIGSSKDNFTTTLGRGGSDYSAAIFANIIGADVLEIWTDVPGIKTTDPRITNEAKIINEISFKEASELATFGAKILHPATLLPVYEMGIPVLVASSKEPEKGGTWIKKEVSDSPLIRAMAIRKNQILLTLSTPEMLNTHGFLFQIFKIFNDFKVSIDAITTSEISVAMTLEADALNSEIISELEELAVVKIERSLSLVSLIGNNINHTPGIGKNIFSAIESINVRMICLGASKHNFCFIVDDNQGEETIKKLHQAFI